MLGEAEADRPATAPAHLAHPRQLGSRERHVGVVTFTLADAAGALEHAGTVTAPSTSANANSSSGCAYVPGTGRPSGTLCR